LISHLIPNSEITILKRLNHDYSDRINELNGFDCILFAGGPLYQPGLYRKSLPFVNIQVIKDIKKPVFFVGGGLHHNPYLCKFSDLDRIFFDKGVCDSVPIGCRDVPTLRFMKREGYRAMLTGCPAWYDLDYVEQTELKSKNPGEIQKICVSEPAKSVNVPLFLDLLLHLRKKYPHAVINILNHREQKKGIVSRLKELNDKSGIGFLDISGSVDGFKAYDDCDLHVGFRVHAHIYNLSRRNLSVLYNEDVRGYGINQTIGLDNFNINAVPNRKKKLFGHYYLMKDNISIIHQYEIIGKMFDDFMDDTIEQNFENFDNAFKKMKRYYQNMIAFFMAVNKVI